MGSIHLVACLLALSAASAQTVEIEGTYWFTQFQSKILAERSRAVTVIDFKKDIGALHQGFPDGRFTFSHKRSRFRFEIIPIRYSGVQAVNQSVRFNGATFPIGARVISRLSVDNPRFTWTYFFVNSPGGRLKIGSMLEGNGFLPVVSLKAPDFGISRSTSLSVGAPAVGMAVEFRPHRLFRLKGEVAGISVGQYGYFVRGEAGVELMPASHIGITAGYRAFDLHADYRPDSVRLTMHGPFAGASLRF